MKHVALFAALMMATPAFAATSVDKMLVASSPLGNLETKTAIDRVTLEFAEVAELLSVAITAPDEIEIEVFQASYAKGAKPTKGKSFDFPLAAPLTAPGRYKVSYLIKTKSVPSLNGFIDFEIMGEGLAEKTLPAE